MQKQELTDALKKRFPQAVISEETQLTEITVSGAEFHETAKALKGEDEFSFDYLISATAVDFVEKMTVVYHLESVKHRHVVVLKSEIVDRVNPSIDTLSDVWATANHHEREIFDLFGIRFNNHPDLRRLFLEDDYGYPLRKDFKDEINIIER